MMRNHQKMMLELMEDFEAEDISAYSEKMLSDRVINIVEMCKHYYNFYCQSGQPHPSTQMVLNDIKRLIIEFASLYQWYSATDNDSDTANEIVKICEKLISINTSVTVHDENDKKLNWEAIKDDSIKVIAHSDHTSFLQNNALVIADKLYEYSLTLKKKRISNKIYLQGSDYDELTQQLQTINETLFRLNNPENNTSPSSSFFSRFRSMMTLD